MGMDYWVVVAVPRIDVRECVDRIAASARFSMAYEFGEIVVGIGDDGDWYGYTDMQEAVEAVTRSFNEQSCCGLKVVDRQLDRWVTAVLRVDCVTMWSTALDPEAKFRSWLAEIMDVLGIGGAEYELDCF